MTGMTLEEELNNLKVSAFTAGYPTDLGNPPIRNSFPTYLRILEKIQRLNVN